MSLWKRLVDLATHAFAGAEPPRPQDPCAPEPGDLDFAAAVVALAAKMAKADGRSTADETAAFHAAFPVSPAERPLLDRLFRLAEETVHGFEGYARRIGRKYADRPCLLQDVLNVLFIVAAADRSITPDEEAFLAKVARLFGFSDAEFARLSQPFFPNRPPDPYTLLGLDISASDSEIRNAWMRLVAESHPDTFLARGAPAEFIASAHERTAALNAAYGRIRDERTRLGARSQHRRRGFAARQPARGDAPARLGAPKVARGEYPQ